MWLKNISPQPKWGFACSSVQAVIELQISGCAATGETIGASYQLEYGEDRIEMHLGHVKEGQRVLLIDDLIATGGTLAAGIKLMHQVLSPSLLHAS